MSGGLHAFLTVLGKECRDNVRDRRTIISTFSLALLGPAFFVGMMTFVLNTAVGDARESFRLAVVGAEHAPQLINHLTQQNVELALLDLPDPRQAVENDQEDLVLEIGADYGARMRAGDMATINLIYDSSEMSQTRRNASMVRQMVGQYAQKLAILRVQLRGMDSTLLAPIRISEIDTASPAARALSILSVLPYLLVLVVFMGGFYLAIDATAGEREHGSLEPLLTQPVSRTQLVLGKVAAASVFSAASTVLFLLSLAISVPFVPLHRVGMSLTIDAATCLGMFAVCLPLIVLGAALLTVVACFARSYKEAQTYLSIVVLVPTMPIIITQMLSLTPSAPLMLIPSLSQATLVTSLIKGEPLVPLHLAVSLGATSVLAALLIALAIWLYRRERMLI